MNGEFYPPGVPRAKTPKILCATYLRLSTSSCAIKCNSCRVCAFRAHYCFTTVSPRAQLSAVRVNQERMSESRPSSSDIVRECAQRLLQAAEQLAPRNVSAAASASRGGESNASSQPNREPSQAADQPRPAAAIEEHRRLFGFRPASVSRGRRPLSSGSAAGRRAHPYSRPYLGPKKNTWTRTFLCLARVNQETLLRANASHWPWRVWGSKR